MASERNLEWVEHLGNWCEGRCAVVTGAGSGIGAALARHAAHMGMNLVVADIAADRISDVEAELSARGASVVAVPTDVRNAESVEMLSDTAYERFGRVDLLVNNAGIESVGLIWEMSAENWRNVQDVNVDGAFHGIRSFVPRMAGQSDSSYVVNVASVASVASGMMNAAYYASKHAVLAMTECLYLECKEHYPQIGVSVVCPAAVSTPIYENALTDGESAESATRRELEQMQSHLREQGISAEVAAQRILSAAFNGDFWISTHPERFLEFAARRAEMLRTLSPP